MKATYLCVPCTVQNITVLMDKLSDDWEKKMVVMKEIIEIIGRYLPSMPPAFIGTKCHRLIQERFNTEDPFYEEKTKSNAYSLDLVKKLEINTLRDAFMYAIASNVIDFWIGDPLPQLENFQKEGLRIDHYQQFEKSLAGIKSILVVVDNAGEIVFDTVLMKKLAGMGKEVFAAAKELPLINDATVEDLRRLKVNEFATIVSTGTYHVGVCREESSAEFRAVWEKADLIIAKGMGAYETIWGNFPSRSILYLLKAKCLPVARSLGVEKGDNILYFTGF